jgi:hypothetical protein
MAQPRLIEDYSSVLLAELPASLAEEVTDGLYEAYGKYLQLGLSSKDAATAAIAEFGDARVVIDSFSRANPARLLARVLLATGPLVGLLWAAELITGRAWDWPVPAIVPACLGAMLAGSITALTTAARARRYQSVRRFGLAGCIASAVIDVSMIAGVVVVAPAVGWPAVLAMCASAARLTGVIRAIRPVRV